MTTSENVKQRRWYWIYFALAAFDLLTVIFSLFLNYYLTETYSESIKANEQWATRLAYFAKLRNQAAAVNAPGNDVFDSLDPVTESRRMQDALIEFNRQFDEAHYELFSRVGITQGGLFLADFEEIQTAMDEMVKEAEMIFSGIQNGSQRAASGHMSIMDRKHALLGHVFAQLENNVRADQLRRFADQRELAKKLRGAEYAIVAAIVLMVLGITLYGSSVMREMTAAAAARESLVAQLQQARNELDRRVEERTAALQRTTESLNAQIVERIAAENKVRVSQGRLRQVIDLVPHFIFAKDSQGRFILANRTLARAYGTTVEDLEGKRDVDFAKSEEEVNRWRQADQEVLQSNAAKVIDAEIRWGADGIERVFSTIKIPFTFSGSERPTVLGVSTDITERTRAQQALQRLNDELEERVRQRTVELVAANKELEAFAYSVSHDLRSPLRGIDGWSLVLMEDYADKLDETAKSHLQRVRAEAGRMSALIDSMLDLSRVTRVDMRREQVDLTRMANDLIAALRQGEPLRQVDIFVEAELVTRGDPNLLRQVLQNLLENAWKFTGKRADARIEFAAEKEEKRTVYRVVDNGAGFDMAYAGKLFGAFQRLHKAAEFPGTGVGLATVQRIIRRHGGEIWVDSNVGEGTKFYFTIGASA